MTVQCLTSRPPGLLETLLTFCTIHRRVGSQISKNESYPVKITKKFMYDFSSNYSTRTMNYLFLQGQKSMSTLHSIIINHLQCRRSHGTVFRVSPSSVWAVRENLELNPYTEHYVRNGMCVLQSLLPRYYPHIPVNPVLTTRVWQLSHCGKIVP